MGILKHILLPLFAVLHASGFYAAFKYSSFAELLGMPLDDGAGDIATRELHMLGLLRGYNFAFVYLHVIGIVYESSHFRGIVIVMEFLFMVHAAVDAYLAGVELYWHPVILSVVALIGIIVHSMEPGLLTKDKDKNKKN